MGDHTIMVIHVIKTFFVQFSCVFLPPLNIFCFCWRFCLFLCLSMHEMFPWLSPIFLKISLVFSTLLFSSISLHCLLKVFLSPPAILWNSAFSWVYLSLSPLSFASLLFSAIFKASSDNHFAFLHLFFLGIALVNTPCTILWTFDYRSSGTVSTRSSPLNLFITSTV